MADHRQHRQSSTRCKMAKYFMPIGEKWLFVFSHFFRTETIIIVLWIVGIWIVFNIVQRIIICLPSLIFFYFLMSINYIRIRDSYRRDLNHASVYSPNKNAIELPLALLTLYIASDRKFIYPGVQGMKYLGLWLYLLGHISCKLTATAKTEVAIAKICIFYVCCISIITVRIHFWLSEP